MTLGKVTAGKVRISPPGRPRDGAREEAILRETLAILSEVGFSGLTVDAVVARAKVSKATIYRRWATKEELAIAAFDLLPPIQSPNTGSLEQDVQSYVEQYTRYLHTTPLRTVLPALISESMHNPALAQRLRSTVSRRRLSGVEIIERAIERGELPVDTNAVLAQELIIGPMLHRSFFDPDNFAATDFQVFARILIAGIRDYWGRGAHASKEKEKAKP